MEDLQARRARAAERALRMVGGVVARGDDVPPMGRTIHERLVMLAEVSARAWALSGQPVPTYTRETMPGRVIRRDG